MQSECHNLHHVEDLTLAILINTKKLMGASDSIHAPPLSQRDQILKKFGAGLCSDVTGAEEFHHAGRSVW